ncbi:hypothetical protein GQ54DRAFT_87078 [Martensiomyces pterosporus]|nr:hypothetical protein GQ54DRAFT_87078 [Martensiomyces pterosporus]
MSQKQHRQENKGRANSKRGERSKGKRAASERERRVCVVENSKGERGAPVHKRKAAEAIEGGAPNTGSRKQRCFPPAHAPQQLETWCASLRELKPAGCCRPLAPAHRMSTDGGKHQGLQETRPQHQLRVLHDVG